MERSSREKNARTNIYCNPLPESSVSMQSTPIHWQQFLLNMVIKRNSRWLNMVYSPHHIMFLSLQTLTHGWLWTPRNPHFCSRAPPWSTRWLWFEAEAIHPRPRGLRPYGSQYTTVHIYREKRSHFIISLLMTGPRRPPHSAMLPVPLWSVVFHQGARVSSIKPHPTPQLSPTPTPNQPPAATITAYPNWDRVKTALPSRAIYSRTFNVVAGTYMFLGANKASSRILHVLIRRMDE